MVRRIVRLRILDPIRLANRAQGGLLFSMKYITLLALLSISFVANADEYIVKYRSVKAMISIKKSSAGKILHHHLAGNLLKVRVSEKSHLALIAQDENVELVVRNTQIQSEKIETISNRPLPPLWSLDKIRAKLAWEKAGTQGSKSVTVAVIDTGVDATHPALVNKVLPGYDFFHNRAGALDEDDHGTHCAGVIAASPTAGNPMSGISPVITILPVKFMGPRGLGNFYDAIRAVDYSIEKKVDIITSSWGAQISDPALAQLLSEMVGRADAAGILFVASAGNLTRDNDVIPYFPANAPFPGVIAVGATDAGDKKIPMSNFGLKVHIAAPGNEIVSTIRKGKYKALSGTSMSAPLVAGLAALMKSVNPKLTAPEIREILQETGEKADMDNACGCRIDALRAVERSLEIAAREN